MNQAAFSHESLPYSSLILSEPLESSYLQVACAAEEEHHHEDHSCSSSSNKPKNVPEELKMFLMSHSDSWYTNEQLAEHLNQ